MPRPRSVLADCSPITQRMASTTLDFPQPLGPTMQVTSWSKCSTVRSTNDLNPETSSFLIFIGCNSAYRGGVVPPGRIRAAVLKPSTWVPPAPGCCNELDRKLVGGMVLHY